MKFGKQISSKILNLSSKMDSLTNPETLDVSPESTNQEGFTWSYLENNDQFNTRQTNLRNGSIDICGGIANQNLIGKAALNLSGSPIRYYPIAYDNQRRMGLAFIPSGTLTIWNGTYSVAELVSQSNFIGNASLYQSIPINIRLACYQLNQISMPSSGTSVMSGFGPYPGYHNTLAPAISNPLVLGVASGLHSLALQANLNSGTLQYARYMGGNDLSPMAVANTQLTFSTYTQSGTKFITPNVTVPFQFSSPITLQSGSAYYFEFSLSNGSGNIVRSPNLLTFSNTGVDVQPNARLMEKMSYQDLNTINIYDSSINSITSFGVIEKPYPFFQMNSYVSAPFQSGEIPGAPIAYAAPLAKGLSFSGVVSNDSVMVQNPVTFNGSLSVPNIDTTAVEFGQVFYLTGVNSYFGAYHYGAPYFLQGFSAFKRNQTPISSTIPYTVGVATYLSQIITSTGSISDATFSTNNRTIIASSSGLVTFNTMPQFSGVNTIFFGGTPYPANDVYTYNVMATGIDPNDHRYFSEAYTVAMPNYGLQKLLSVFDTPVTVSTTGAYYMLSVKYYDAVTNGPYSDYNYINIPANSGLFAPNTQFLSLMRHGVENKVSNSGTYVTNYSNDGLTFLAPSGLQTNPRGISLSCGLLTNVSGNAIVGMYDYRIQQNRTQAVVYGQGQNLNYFTLTNPNKLNHTTIYKGSAPANNQNLWQFTTFNNLLFGTNYSANPNQCWDQIASGTQAHGLRPTFTATEVSGVTSFSSGQQYSVLLATQMSSGGVRSSILSGLTLSGFRGSIQLTGISPSNKYNFDIPLNSTYVFVTQNSGSILYLANIYSGTSLSGNRIPNPFPNSLNGCFINEVDTVTNNGQVINSLINYDQQYLTTQVPTPSGKAIFNYSNYIGQIGDPNFPSRFWYSDSFGPQIWGTDGRYNGYVDIDPDNGAPLTSWGIYRQFLFLTKTNSTYRIDYTGNNNQPFEIISVSPTIGSIGAFSTVSTDFGVFGLSQYGIFKCDYNGVSIISDAILPFFETLSATDLTFAVGIHDQFSKQIIWSITNSQINPLKNFGIVYNYKDNSFSIRRGGMWTMGSRIGDANNFSLLFVGDVLGQISQINVPNVYTDTEFSDGVNTPLVNQITMTAKSPWLGLGNSSNSYQLKRVHFNIDAAVGTQLRLDVYFNGDENTIQYSRYIDLSRNTPDKNINLNGICRTFKFVLTNIGSLNAVKVKSFQLDYIAIGSYIAG